LRQAALPPHARGRDRSDQRPRRRHRSRPRRRPPEPGAPPGGWGRAVAAERVSSGDEVGSPVPIADGRAPGYTLLMETRDTAERAAAAVQPDVAIVRDPRRCGGDPILAGTRTAVHAVISYLKHYEGDPERVRDEALPHLTIEQIHAAIDWYGEHQ